MLVTFCGVRHDTLLVLSHSSSTSWGSAAGPRHTRLSSRNGLQCHSARSHSLYDGSERPQHLRRSMPGRDGMPGRRTGSHCCGSHLSRGTHACSRSSPRKRNDAWKCARRIRCMQENGQTGDAWGGGRLTCDHSRAGHLVCSPAARRRLTGVRACSELVSARAPLGLPTRVKARMECPSSGQIRNPARIGVCASSSPAIEKDQRNARGQPMPGTGANPTGRTAVGVARGSCRRQAARIIPPWLPSQGSRTLQGYRSEKVFIIRGGHETRLW